MATKAERDERLDVLVSATKAWAEARRDQLKKQVATSKKILQGRTGSERLAQASVQAAGLLVIQEIDDFLVVG